MSDIDGIRAQLRGGQTPPPNPMGSVTPPPSPMGGGAPTPPNPMGNPGSGELSLTEQMRQRMRQAQGQATTSTVMQQGMNYEPQGTNPAPQKPNTNPQPINIGQPNGQATQTLINTTIQEDNSGKPKLNKTMVLGIIGGVLVLGVLAITLLPKLQGSSGGTSTDIVEEIPPEDELVWIEPEITPFTYTPEQIAELRKVGYTGSEIEQYQAFQTDYYELLTLAEEERQAWLEEAIAPLLDTASPEYKEYISDTWLYLPEREDVGEWERLASYYQERKNLDYEKIEVHGNQLFIKVYLDDDLHQDWFFLNVSPEEYIKLKDFGNVVVTYTYATRMVGDVNDPWSMVEDKENIFITSASLEIIN